MATLTEKERSTGRINKIISIISYDIQNHRFDEMQQLCETVGLNNRDLAARLKEERTVGYSFLDMIYYDILLVLADKIGGNQEHEDIFLELYKKRYSNAYKVFEQYAYQYEKYGYSLPELVKDIKKLSQIELEFFAYNSLRYDYKWFDRDVYSNEIAMENYRFHKNDSFNNLESVFVFENTDDEILKSKNFERYIIKRRQELAEYLNVSIDKLDETIHESLKTKTEEGMSSFGTGISGKIGTSTKQIIIGNNGGWIWHDQITRERGNLAINYTPDVNRIIKDYYTSLIISKFIECKNNKEPFTKIVLSRECKSTTIEEDYACILCMYEIDVVYKMFSLMMEKYYQDFSWEKITQNDLLSRYDAIVSNLKSMIRKKDIDIESLTRKVESLRLQNITEEDGVVKPFVAENNKLNKIIDEKDEEIIDLKRKIEIQNEFIEELLKPEEPETTEAADIEILKSKRYLFVGAIDEALPELKKVFSDSVFMTSETTNITQIEVDAVVMLTRWMSHSMFYKIKAAKKLDDVPTIMCNTKNFDRILWDMYKGINE